MYKFESKKPVSFRPTDEDAEFLNENIHLLRPEPRQVDGSPVEPTFREMCLFWAEKAIAIVKANKTRQPEDVAKIEALEEQIKQLQEIQRQNARELETKTTEIEELNSKLDSNTMRIIELQHENSTLKEGELQENQIVLTLSNEEMGVLVDQRNLLSKKEKREISNKDILFSLFYKYVTLQETQISFPWLRSVSSLKKLILKIREAGTWQIDEVLNSKPL